MHPSYVFVTLWRPDGVNALPGPLQKTTTNKGPPGPPQGGPQDPPNGPQIIQKSTLDRKAGTSENIDLYSVPGKSAPPRCPQEASK